MFKIEKYLFLLLLFSIPFQKRVFLWSGGVMEGFNEWQSVFLYGTDILILALFVIFALRHVTPQSTGGSRAPAARARLRSRRFHSAKAETELKAPARATLSGSWLRLRELRKRNIPASLIYLLLIAFLFIAFISIFNASYTGVAVYRFIKLAELVGIFFYTIYIMRRIKFEHAALAFAGGAVLQSLIAIGQFFRQGALGLGVILGESPISAGRSDVAEFVSFGSRFMRAYGTLPSPNVLAAFLALALLFLLTWHIMQKNTDRRERVLAWAGIVLISFALLLTFSRAQIASLALAFIFYLVVFTKKDLRVYRKKLFIVLAPLVVSVVAMFVIFWPEIYSRIFTTFQPEDHALSERVFYSELSYQVISENPGGIGAGNYTLFLRDIFPGLRDALYQPVHNIYLLTTAELGIAGGIAFVLFVLYLLLRAFQKLYKEPSPKLLFFTAAFIFILTSGFFDHFYWTLQQGALMFWIVAAMLYNEAYVSKN